MTSLRLSLPPIFCALRTRLCSLPFLALLLVAFTSLSVATWTAADPANEGYSQTGSESFLIVSLGSPSGTENMAEGETRNVAVQVTVTTRDL